MPAQKRSLPDNIDHDEEPTSHHRPKQSRSEPEPEDEPELLLRLQEQKGKVVVQETEEEDEEEEGEGGEVKPGEEQDEDDGAEGYVFSFVLLLCLYVLHWVSKFDFGIWVTVSFPIG